MNIPQKKEISIRELIDGYDNKDEEGIYGYGGRLNIRPKYQREFIYNKPQQQEGVKPKSRCIDFGKSVKFAA